MVAVKMVVKREVVIVSVNKNKMHFLDGSCEDVDFVALNNC